MFDNDEKIDKLLDAQGWIGFSIYFFICQKGYATDGYFYKWSAASSTTIARKMGAGVRSGTVKATVEVCVHCGLFDNRLFEAGILTSRGMQRRFAHAIASRRVRRAKADYWLLDADETAKFRIELTPSDGSLPSSHEKQESNAHLQEAKRHLQPANRQRKGNSTGGSGSVSFSVPVNPFVDNGEEETITLDRVVIYAENNLLPMSPNNLQELVSFRDELPDELIIHAIDDACGRGIRNYNYVKSILNRCIEENIRTVGAFEAAAENHAKKKGGAKSGNAGRPDDSGPRRLFEGQTIV